MPANLLRLPSLERHSTAEPALIPWRCWPLAALHTSRLAPSVVARKAVKALPSRSFCAFQQSGLHCRPGKPCAKCQAGKPAPQLKKLKKKKKKQGGAQVETKWDPKQRWAAEADVDREVRRDCAST